MKKILSIACLSIILLVGCTKEDKDTSKTFDPNKCIDLDGREYKTQVFGEQTWMVENYAYLPKVHKQTQRSSDNPRYYVYKYDDTDVAAAKETKIYNIYGALYNYAAAKTSAPKGWHLPTDAEWKELEAFLGLAEEELDKTSFRGVGEGLSPKSRSTEKWYSDRNGTNETGFNAYPAGSNNFSYGFMGLTLDAVFLTDTESDKAGQMWDRIFTFDTDGIGRSYANLKSAYPVRYIKNK